MSATTRALSIPEIVTQVFVHLPEPDCWTAAPVSQLWWGAAQYAALLTRDRVCSDPDGCLVALAAALQSGPSSAGEVVKHVTLSSLDRLDPDNSQFGHVSNRRAHHPARTVLSRCRDIVSVALYGQNHLADLVKLYAGKQVTWARLACINADLSQSGLHLPFASLRHLDLTGLPIPASIALSRFPRFPTGVGISSAQTEYFPPALNLESRTLTNIGLVKTRSYDFLRPEAPPDSLPAQAMTWLLDAAHGGTPSRAGGVDQTCVGLRELRYRLDDLRSAGVTRLSGAAIAAIPAGAPHVRVLELWLAPTNITDDLDAVFALLDMSSLSRLELGVFVALERVIGGQGRLDELKVKLAEAVAGLDEGRRAKVVLLD